MAPGSTVVRTSPTTTVIKEPGVPEDRVMKNDIAKFGTRAERNTDLWQYAQRRFFPYDKTKKDRSAHKDLKKKYRGEIKIRHRPTQSDAASRISSANSNISKVMSSRKPKKPQAGRNRSRQSSTTLNTSNASSIAASSVTSSTASPSTSKSKRTRKAPDFFGLESSVCSVSDYSVPVSKRHKSTNPVIETVIQEEALQPPALDASSELPVVSPPAPPLIGTWSPKEYDYDDYAREISLSVFDAENQI